MQATDERCGASRMGMGMCMGMCMPRGQEKSSGHLHGAAADDRRRARRLRAPSGVRRRGVISADWTKHINLGAVQQCKLPWEGTVHTAAQGQSVRRMRDARFDARRVRCVCAPNALIAAAISIRPRLRLVNVESKFGVRFVSRGGSTPLRRLEVAHRRTKPRTANWGGKYVEPSGKSFCSRCRSISCRWPRAPLVRSRALPVHSRSIGHLRMSGGL